MREVDERDQAAVDAVAELLAVTPARLRIALRYFASYEREVDAEITEADSTSRAAERVWQTDQRLLA